MKKSLFFIVLILSTQMAMAVAIERVTSNSLRFYNFSQFSFSLLNMQLSINAQIYEINNLNIKKAGPLDVAPGERIEFDGLTIPPGGASIALWYQGTFPGTPTSAQMASFFQFGSAGHEYEAIAVQAGLWSAGTFVPGMPPFIRDGNYSSWGAGNWSNGLNEDEHALKVAVSVFPNPFNNQITISDLNKEIVTAEIVDGSGKICLRVTSQSETNFILSTENLKKGIYQFRITSKTGRTQTTRLMKL